MKLLFLPNETWLDVLQFCSRSDLGHAVSLCCRSFHALSYPLMHKLGTRQIQRLYVWGSDGGDQRTFYACHHGKPHCISMDEPPPENIACIRTLCIYKNMTAGVYTFVLFLSRHGLLRTLNVLDEEIYSGSKVLRDVLSAEYSTLFTPRPLFTELCISSCTSHSFKVRRLLSHPTVLGLPSLHICIGRTAELVGPLLSWLHWSHGQIGQEDEDGNNQPQQQHRLLRITLAGVASDQFLKHFLTALVQRFIGARHAARPFCVEIRSAKWNEYPVLDAEPQWHNQQRPGAVLRVVAKNCPPDPADASNNMRVYRIEHKLTNDNNHGA